MFRKKLKNAFNEIMSLDIAKNYSRNRQNIFRENTFVYLRFLFRLGTFVLLIEYLCKIKISFSSLLFV